MSKTVEIMFICKLTVPGTPEAAELFSPENANIVKTYIERTLLESHLVNTCLGETLEIEDLQVTTTTTIADESEAVTEEV